MLNQEINKKKRNRGISLLLVVLVMSTLFSIGVGIANTVFGYLKLSGEAADSYISFFAADESIERVLYLDRIKYAATGICVAMGNNFGNDCYTNSGDVSGAGGNVPTGCFNLAVDQTPVNTNILASGQYRCGANASRVVKRAFEVLY